MGVDSRSKAQKHLLTDALFGGVGVDLVNLLISVGYEAADTHVDCVLDIGVCLVIAVKIYLIHRETGARSGVKLTGRYNVDRHTCIGDYLIHFGKAE